MICFKPISFWRYVLTCRRLIFSLLVIIESSQSATPKPNIIFVLADDLGYGDLGILFQNSRKNSPISTPELDKMATEGMVLERHYTAAPVCAPARGTLITGMHQGHANIRDNQFDKALEDNLNFANTLHSAGYYTAMIGKYGLQGMGKSPDEWEAYPTKRGFDYYYGYVRHNDGHQHYPANTWAMGENSGSQDPKEIWENNQEVSSGLDKCYTADLFTARAKKLIVDRVTQNSGQPFFLYLAYDTPHAALQLPTSDYPNGKGKTGGLQWNGQAGQMINTAKGTIDSFRNPLYTGKGLSEAGVRFATAVTRLDQCVGDVLQTLRDLKIDKNTIVVFTSDNGPHSESFMQATEYTPKIFQSYGPFEGMKRDVYEGGIRMPTLVWGPSLVQANAHSTRLSQFQDWMATFCDYAGLNKPARIDGVSLKTTLSGIRQPKEEASTVYVEYDVAGSMPNYPDFANNKGTSRMQSQVLFLNGYKGLRNNINNAAMDFKIFNLEKDSLEGNNLAGTSSAFISLQQQMKDEVLRIRMPNSSAPRAYDSEFVPSVTPKLPISGLSVKTYTGKWDWVPDFNLMDETQNFTDNTIDIDHLTGTVNSGLLITGFISVPQKGTWTFYSQANKGLIFKIHKKLVLDADYNYTGNEISQSVNLEKGLHPFKLYYYSDGVSPSMTFKWSGPGISKSPVAAEFFFHEKNTVDLNPKMVTLGLHNINEIRSHRLDGKKVSETRKIKIHRFLFPSNR